MTLSEHQNIFVNNIAYLIFYAKSININLTFGEAYRTKEQQEIYYNTGKSKTMNSNHLKRLAVDFNFFIDGKLIYDKDQLQKLGDYWEKIDEHNKWGGNFNTFIDTPHFERKI